MKVSLALADDPVLCLRHVSRWSFFYIFSVFIFMYHACIGWKKALSLL